MPFSEIMHKFKAGTLHSGSDKGPKVKSRKQAIAIGMSYEKGHPNPKQAESMHKRSKGSKHPMMKRGFAGLG